MNIDDDSTGAQIDMLIERADRVINICEIKFSKGEIVIDKSTAQNLRNKLSATENIFPRRNIFLTMVTTFGVKDNEYHKELIQNQVTLNQLFN